MSSGRQLPLELLAGTGQPEHRAAPYYRSEVGGEKKNQKRVKVVSVGCRYSMYVRYCGELARGKCSPQSVSPLHVTRGPTDPRSFLFNNCSPSSSSPPLPFFSLLQPTSHFSFITSISLSCGLLVPSSKHPVHKG